jgi:hypothetical protein
VEKYLCERTDADAIMVIFGGIKRGEIIKSINF